MEPNQRWIPGVSFWQTLIDTKNAATVVPGEFFVAATRPPSVYRGNPFQIEVALAARELLVVLGGLDVDDVRLQRAGVAAEQGVRQRAVAPEEPVQVDSYQQDDQRIDNPETAHIPVVMVSGKVSAADVEQGTEVGAVDYIKKPFSIPVVKARVRRHLGAARTGVSPMIGLASGLTSTMPPH